MELTIEQISRIRKAADQCPELRKGLQIIFSEAFKAKNTIEYRVGQVFANEDGEEYILACTGYKMYCLIDLCSGNRWMDSIKIKNLRETPGDSELWGHSGRLGWRLKLNKWR